MAQRKPRINEEINSREVRLIDSDGTQLGVFVITEALKKASNKNLDLVEIAPQAKPPVCKIIDFGKYQYEQKRRDKIQKKKQVIILLKEIRMRPNTDDHDFNFKARHAKKFIEDGNKVKVSVFFRGRELAYKEHGRTLLERFVEELSDVAKIENPIKFEGRSMITILTPITAKKNK